MVYTCLLSSTALIIFTHRLDRIHVGCRLLGHSRNRLDGCLACHDLLSFSGSGPRIHKKRDKDERVHRTFSAAETVFNQQFDAKLMRFVGSVECTVETSVVRLNMSFFDKTIFNHKRISLGAIPSKD